MNGFDLEIEWDSAKAEANVRKHGVSFNLASTVLRDPLSVTTLDEVHGELEERWITVGRAVTGECLVVAHTWIELDANTAKARIISARRAENSERREYEEGL
ncbi:MAG: BrnT family toxin [Bryobacteraceae bacterium]